MKINVAAVLKAIEGEDLMLTPGNGKPPAPFTVRRALIEGLMVPREDDSGDEKCRKYGVAIRVQENDEVELAIEDVLLIKKAVGAWGGPLVVGQIFKLLDG